MSKISRFIFGAYILTVPCECAENALNVLVTCGIPFGKTKERDGAYTFCLTRSGFRRYLEKCGGNLVFGETAKEIGFLALLGRYRLRFGMFAGALLFVFAVSFSSFFVWDINVTGNVNITEAEIIERLDAYGFRLGAFVPRLDTADICRHVILEAGDISFMTINMRGTVATVVVHESTDSEGVVESSDPSNLISKYDAQIARIEVAGGVSEVKYLQSVKKGELLISGIIDSNALGYRLVRARGEVWGKTTLFYESEISLEQSEKTLTGEQTVKKSVKFFSKMLNLSKNINIPYEKYDTIVNEKKLYLFGIIELPVFIVTETYTEYKEVPTTLSRNEAYSRALADITAQSEAELSGAEILSRSITLKEEENSLRLYMEVECILNIAEEVKIETARR